MWNYVNVAHGAARTHIRPAEATVFAPALAKKSFRRIPQPMFAALGTG